MDRKRKPKKSELCEERGWSNYELMNKSGIDEDIEELSRDDMSIVAISRKLNASDRRRALAYM